MKRKLLILLLILLCFNIVKGQNTNFKFNTSYPVLKNDKKIKYSDLDDLNRNFEAIKKLNAQENIDKIETEKQLKELYEKIEKIGGIYKDNRTVYSAKYKHYNEEKSKLQVEKDSLISVMHDSVMSDATLDENEKKIKEIDRKINAIDRKISDINDIEQFRSNGSFFLLLKKSNCNAFYNIVYGENSEKVNFLNNSGLLLGNKTGSIYTELASGNFKLIRASIGTMVSSSSQEDNPKEEEAYNRLATSGGNTVLSLEYPFLYAFDNSNQFNLIGRFIGKFTADFPAFGSQTEDFAGSASIGLDLYLDFATDNNDLRFYGNLNASRYSGTDRFKTNLAIENRNFNFGKLSAGIVIKQKLNLSVMFNTFSSEEVLEKRNIIIGGNLLF